MSHFFKKSVTLTWTILLISLLALTVGCANTTNPNTSTTPSEKTITVGTLQIADALPLYVAAQEGYFKEEGLDISIQAFKSSSEEAQALSAGSIQIAMNDLIVQSLLKKENADVRTIAMALGATAQEGRFVIVSAPNSNIKTPYDLKGKRIAISTNTMMEFLTDSYLKHENIDKSTITYINMPNLLLRLETLLAGADIDAAILPDPLATIAIARGAHPVIDDTMLSENYSQSVIIASQKWIAANDNDRVAFLRAYNKAITAINASPEKYRPLLTKIARIPENLQATYPMPTFTAGAVPTVTDVERIETWMTEHNLLKAPYTYTEMVTQQQ